MSWQQTPLAELANVRSGGGAPQSADDFSETGHPFVRAGSLIKLLTGTLEMIWRRSIRLLPPNTA
jgi:hypothetical protein